MSKLSRRNINNLWWWTQHFPSPFFVLCLSLEACSMLQMKCHRWARNKKLGGFPGRQRINTEPPQMQTHMLWTVKNFESHRVSSSQNFPSGKIYPQEKTWQQTKKQRQPENKIQIRKPTIIQFRITCSLNDKGKIVVMTKINFAWRRLPI